MDASDVTAVLVTRNEDDGAEVAEDLFRFFTDTVVWNNNEDGIPDIGAFGRYASIFLNDTAPVIYVQDDDCIVSDVDKRRLLDSYEPGVLSVLMPPERVDYKDTVLIGWGALFDWNLPLDAFRRWRDAGHLYGTDDFRIVGCDFVFPMLTPWKRLDAQHRDLPHAHAPNRTWASYPNYANLKAKFLDDARAMR